MEGTQNMITQIYIACAILGLVSLALCLNIFKKFPSVLRLPWMWILLTTGLALIISTIVLKVYGIIYTTGSLVQKLVSVYFFLGNVLILIVLVKIRREVSK